jgi:hypothetical protein
VPTPGLRVTAPTGTNVRAMRSRARAGSTCWPADRAWSPRRCARGRPEAVLLEGVLELDTEAAREHREVVLDRDGALRLEGAELALAAVYMPANVSAPAAMARSSSPAPGHASPRAQSRHERGVAAPAEARVGREIDERHARHRASTAGPPRPRAASPLLHHVRAPPPGAAPPAPASAPQAGARGTRRCGSPGRAARAAAPRRRSRCRTGTT